MVSPSLSVTEVATSLLTPFLASLSVAYHSNKNCSGLADVNQLGCTFCPNFCNSSKVTVDVHTSVLKLPKLVNPFTAKVASVWVTTPQSVMILYTKVYLPIVLTLSFIVPSFATEIIPVFSTTSVRTPVSSVVGWLLNKAFTL